MKISTSHHHVKQTRVQYKFLSQLNYHLKAMFSILSKLVKTETHKEVLIIKEIVTSRLLPYKDLKNGITLVAHLLVVSND